MDLYDLSNVTHQHADLFNRVIPDMLRVLRARAGVIKRGYYYNSEYDSNVTNFERMFNLEQVGVIATSKLEANLILILSRLIIDMNHFPLLSFFEGMPTPITLDDLMEGLNEWQDDETRYTVDAPHPEYRTIKGYHDVIPILDQTVVGRRIPVISLTSIEDFFNHHVYQFGRPNKHGVMMGYFTPREEEV